MVNVFGVWSLVSLNLTYHNATIGQPWGPKPLGKLVITPTGYLSVLIIRPELAIPLPNGTLWKNATDAQLGPLARNMVTYCGHYDMSNEDGQLVLTTHIDVSLNPEIIGVRAPRNVTFVEERGKEYMDLRPQGIVPDDLPPDVNRAEVEKVLRWERELM